MEIARNTIILAWRWLDFGRFGEWICLGILMWMGSKKPAGNTVAPIERRLQILFLCLFVLLSYSALRYNNLSAHRYFLPLYLAFHLIVFQWIVKTPLLGTAAKKGVFALLSFTFAVSNFQVYPHGISMDWDSTLAHLPYHEIRKEGIAYLKQQHIPLQEVGTAFPNINTGENIELNGDTTSFAPIDIRRNNYIFISNVYNDVSKEDRKTLHDSWNLVWQRHSGPVWGEIYKKTILPE